MKLQIPGGKRALVDRANSHTITTVAIAAVVVIFCLVVSKSLWDQSRFQSRVIEKKEVARDQLIANIDATESLVTSYQAFVSEQPNIIDGNINGGGERDGDNAQIILDALPSKYDFPALATSIEKILSQQGIQIDAIKGTDQQIEQNAGAVVADAQPIEMPFEFTVTLSTDASRILFERLEQSIRPIQFTKFSIDSQSNSVISLTVSAKTFYKPKTGVNIQTETVR